MPNTDGTAGAIGEAGIIRLISRWLKSRENDGRLIDGIGNDCAVLKPVPGRLLLTTDSFVENVHFRPAWTTPAQAGWKAMAANVSDVAAAGGVPLAAVISLELPPRLKIAWLKGFYSGLLKAARKYKFALAGGNISRGLRFSAHIALTGAAPRGRIGRDGARPGQILAVTGRLGGAQAGLLCLKRGIRGPAAHRSIRRHLLPQPSLTAGRLLARSASALIDISDGLLREARLIAEASRIRILIRAEKLPIFADACRLAASLGKDPVSLALTSGEEYELLACLPRRAFRKVARTLARHAIKLTAIGTTERGRGVETPDRPGSDAAGFDHFR